MAELPQEVWDIIGAHLPCQALLSLDGVNRCSRSAVRAWLASANVIAATGSRSLEFLKWAASHAPNVERVAILNCYKLNDTTLAILCYSWPNLRSIKLTGCSQITAKSLAILPLFCPFLQHVDLDGLPLVHRRTAFSIIDSNVGLRHFRLNGSVLCSAPLSRSLHELAQEGAPPFGLVEARRTRTTAPASSFENPRLVPRKTMQADLLTIFSLLR